MAATDRSISRQSEPGPTPAYAPEISQPAARQPAAPRLEVTRLAALHREAAETAHLANLLGRTPYAIAGLTVAAGLALAMVYGSTPSAQLVSWLVLLAMGLGACARAYGQALHAPFERAPLHAFAQDLSAILAYTGCAWGAGAFLVLPASAGPLGQFAFAVLPPALVALSLRTRETALPFLAPAILLAAFAMVLRSLPGGALGAAFTLLGAAAIAAAALWFDRRQTSRSSLPQLAELPFGERTAL